MKKYGRRVRCYPEWWKNKWPKFPQAFALIEWEGTVFVNIIPANDEHPVRPTEVQITHQPCID